MSELATIERTETALTETGWDPQRELSFEEWVEAGQWLAGINRASQWGLGDWLLYGAHRYGEKYITASLTTGYEEQSLKNMRRVAQRFEKSRRRDLSWSHHEAVTTLEPAEQDRVLADAEDKHWSVVDVRDVVRGDPPGTTRARAESSSNGNGNGKPKRQDPNLISTLTFEQGFSTEALKRSTEKALRAEAKKLGFKEKRVTAE